MPINIETLLNDPAFTCLEPDRREYFAALSKKLNGRSTVEAAQMLIKARTDMPDGRELSDAEIKAMIAALLNALPEDERKQYKLIFSLVGIKT